MNGDPITLEFRGLDGIRLVADRRGDPGAPPVVFLHGGGQTRHSWGGTASRVMDHGWQAITLDARGHGESDWSETGDYRMESFARDLVCFVERLDRPPVLIGASLGGLSCMLMAGELVPGTVRGVVLVDIVPDMEPAGAQRINAFMMERAYEGFGAIEEVADAVAAYNPHRPRPTDLSGLRKNLRQRDGRFYWHWDPRFMDGARDTGPEESLSLERFHDAVARLVADVPVMLVRGRASDLVSAEKAAEFCERFPTVEFVDVSGAGHMVAGDRNDAFTTAVLGFLDRFGPVPT